MAPPPVSGEQRLQAPARAVWVALAAFALVRIGLTFVPSMAGWGLNVQRFVPALWACVLVGVPVAALTPALARPLAAWLDRRHFDRWSWRIACAVAAAVLVWALPDAVTGTTWHC